MGLVLEHLERASRDLVFLEEDIEARIGVAEVSGHPVRNEFNRLTKRCIARVKRGDQSLVPEIRARLPLLPQEFEKERLFTRVQRAEFVETAQAEGVEALYFAAYYPHLFRGTVAIPAEELTPEALGVSHQAYVTGLADVVGELDKALLDWRALRKPPLEEELFILDRFLEIVADIVTLLSRIGVPDKYLTVTSREGDYRDTFSGRLIGAKRKIVDRRGELRYLQFGQRLERRLLPLPSEAST